MEADINKEVRQVFYLSLIFFNIIIEEEMWVLWKIKWTNR